MLIKIGKSKRDPLKKRENRHSFLDTLQPWKKSGGKVIENEKFYKYYGGERAKEKEFNRDPELAKYLQKKYSRPEKK